MSRLIDVDKLPYEKMEISATSEEWCVRLSDIESAPTIDAEPTIHGKWISIPHKLARICNICRKDEPYKFADEDADVYDYCPHCGAKMDGERKTE